MSTRSLNIDLVTEGQTDKEPTIATAEQALEYATQRNLAVDLSSGDVTLGISDFTRNFRFQCSGLAANRNLVVPLTVDGLAHAAPRFFMVDNASAFLLTVKGASGASAIVGPSEEALLVSDGTDIARAGTHSTDIGIFWRGVLTDLCLIVQYIAARPFTIPAVMVRSQGVCGVNPTSSAVLTFKKNGSSFGTLTFNTSGVPTFAAATATAFVPGDILTVFGQASADATLADVSATIWGART